MASCGGRATLPRTDRLSRLCLFSDQFQVVPLRFSKDLDAHNPNTPEWREDVGLVVTRLLSKVLPASQRQSLPAPVGVCPGGGEGGRGGGEGPDLQGGVGGLSLCDLALGWHPWCLEDLLPWL